MCYELYSQLASGSGAGPWISCDLDQEGERTRNLQVALAMDLPKEGLRRGDIVTIVEYVQGESDGEGYFLEVFSALGQTLYRRPRCNRYEPMRRWPFVPLGEGGESVGTSKGVPQNGRPHKRSRRSTSSRYGQRGSGLATI